MVTNFRCPRQAENPPIFTFCNGEFSFFCFVEQNAVTVLSVNVRVHAINRTFARKQVMFFFGP